MSPANRIAELQIALEHERDRVQSLIDTIGAILASVGGPVEISPQHVDQARRRSVQYLSADLARLAVVRLVPKS